MAEADHVHTWIIPSSLSSLRTYYARCEGCSSVREFPGEMHHMHNGEGWQKMEARRKEWEAREK